jgi:hypothetical protein
MRKVAADSEMKEVEDLAGMTMMGVGADVALEEIEEEEGMATTEEEDMETIVEGARCKFQTSQGGSKKQNVLNKMPSHHLEAPRRAMYQIFLHPKLVLTKLSWLQSRLQ